MVSQDGAAVASDLADRFWSRVDVAPASDACWLWTGPRQSEGYGVVYWRGERRYAHRLVWTLVSGAIQPGIQIMHRCGVRVCVRPEHLFPATAAEAGRYKAEQGLMASGDRSPARLYPERRARTTRRSCKR